MMADEQETVTDPGLRARVSRIIEERRRREAEGGTTSKNGKKRKVAAPQVNEPEEPKMDLDQATAAFAPVAFALMAPLTDRIDPDKPYTLEEAAMLTRAVLALSEKYPDFDYAEELAVVLVLGAQLGGRYLAAQVKKSEQLPLGLPAN